MSRPHALTFVHQGALPVRVYAFVLFVLGPLMIGGRAAAADTAPSIGPESVERALSKLSSTIQSGSARAVSLYRDARPMVRMAWGGVAGCGIIALTVLFDRAFRNRRARAIPTAFRKRFLERFARGELDWSQGVDYCELNPSPAARIALAAFGVHAPLGESAEHSLANARRVEVERMQRNLKTLARIAVIAPLVGLFGALAIAGDSFAALDATAAWGPMVAWSIAPLTASVGMAILALLAYDGLSARVEKLAGELDHVARRVLDGLAAQRLGQSGKRESRARGEVAGVHRPYAAARQPAAQLQPDVYQ